MPRRLFNDGQEIVLQDFNDIPAAVERGLYDRLFYEMLERSQNAFFSDSFQVAYASPNSIVVKKGSGFQYDSTQVSPEPNYRPLYNPSDMSVTISSPDSINNRIDLVCVQAALATELTATRNYKDAISTSVTPQTMVVQEDWISNVQVVTGTPASSPVAPAVPSGFIAIAQLAVSAVTGMSGTGAVTDLRTLMPIGSNVLYNTTGFNRLPASSATTMAAILSVIDSLLTYGHQGFIDLDDLSANPATPSSGRQRFFAKNGVAFFESSGGTVVPLGSGGGGGDGGTRWAGVAAAAPVGNNEFDTETMAFSLGAAQSAVLWYKVPSGYLTGSKIRMVLDHYTPGSSGTWQFQAVTTLIRRNNDAINSSANSYNSTNGVVTNSVAYQMTEVTYDLTTTVGTINGFAISPGDMLKVVLTRITPASGTEDTNDIRMIPSSTEVLTT